MSRLGLVGPGAAGEGPGHHWMDVGILSRIHCIVCTVYSVHCTLYILKLTIYTIQYVYFKLSTLNSTGYSVQFRVCSPYSMYSVHPILFSLYNVRFLNQLDHTCAQMYHCTTIPLYHNTSMLQYSYVSLYYLCTTAPLYHGISVQQ